MKNKTKIRIIKDKVNNDSYTFLTESQPPSVFTIEQAFRLYRN